MPVYRGSDVPKVKVEMEGAEAAHIQEFITEREGAPNFALRVFELEPGGYTPYHVHEWEHENYILDGEGELVRPDGSTTPLHPGDAALVSPMEKHQYRNTGNGLFRFICCIPVKDPCNS